MYGVVLVLDVELSGERTVLIAFWVHSGSVTAHCGVTTFSV